MRNSSARALRPYAEFRGSAVHAASARARMLWCLLAVNIILLFVGTTILGLEFANLYKLQTSYKAMSYSIKLKLEFSILNQLVGVTREQAANRHSGGGGQAAARGAGSRWDSGTAPSHPSPMFGTVSTWSAEERRRVAGLGRWAGLSVAMCFSCGRRESKEGEKRVGGGGGVVQTTDISVNRGDERAQHVEMLNRANTADTAVDGRSVDITAANGSRNQRKDRD